ncbi:MAG: SDR family oxidoreductase [Acidimicrobiales bacterium]|jgi:NAD(P)-dependent dehydrogenase (short-subunit alcohol dehydrogenase family)|nr:SDR family oxidoreductase [Acidimicrobiales bacterium]MDP6910733.1 SDR family oxidoreductase [Acidimicrobiales bacterium]
MATILITGSNSGFGRLAVFTLARQGHQVVATMRTVSKGDDLRRLAEGEGLDIEIRQLDVTDPDSVEAAIADPASIDVLVNNAGFEVQGAIEQIDDVLMQRQLETNVMGPLRTMRAVLPAWSERGSGVIVNVSSIAGRVAPPYSGAYAASKHALEALTESLHFEVSHLGIRVHLIEPGRFPTNFSDNIVFPPAWEGSPHEDRALIFRDSLTSLDGDGTGTPADPQLVADSIVRAATDPSTPFRTLVGGDAELIDATKTSMSFEDFETTMRAALDWHD